MKLINGAEGGRVRIVVYLTRIEILTLRAKTVVIIN
jgi:hypothetical protein